MAQITLKETGSLSPERKRMLNRLRRVEGQIRGIQKMIIEEKDCSDVLLQLSAARKALQKACIEILKNDIVLCMISSEEEDPEKKDLQKINLTRLEKLIEALVDISPIK